MGYLEEEQALQAEVDKMLSLLTTHESVQAFKDIQGKAQNHPGLKELEEKIKRAQKDAVAYAHYDKPEAEKQAVHEINDLNKAYKTHPLVENYRDRLIEADELLQHVSTMIQKEVNERIEGEE
ncbi:YlbF family regulator [Enterococcus sp.]|uniref:YlbF family regulator n=1 Tax=Enterococcus sp. TaxID=35783 RepID=UPI002FCB4CA1